MACVGPVLAFSEPLPRLLTSAHCFGALDQSTLLTTHLAQRFSSPLYTGISDTPPLKLVSVHTPTPTTSQLVFTYTLPDYYANPLGNLHGAAHSLIYDNCTTLALAAVSTPGFWMLGGVSRVLDVKYLRAVKVGEEVRIECEVLHVGRTQAAIRGVIKDGQGRVCSTCEHDKTNIDPPAAQQGKAKL